MEVYLVLSGRGACHPNLAWHVENDTLFERRNDFDVEIVASANGFDDLLDNDLGS
jgi:hypothetical protein